MTSSGSRGSVGPSPVSSGAGHDSDDEDVANGELWDHSHQMEYIGLDGSFGAGLSPQPSSSAECAHRVSPQDPNLSSAARYSPPPPYSSPMAVLSAALDHPDSPMEDLSHGPSLPILPAGVSSSSPTVPDALPPPDPHALPHSSVAQPSASRATTFVSANSLFSTQPLARSHWSASPVLTDDEDENDATVSAVQTVTPALGESVWARQRRLAMKNIVIEDPQPGPSGLQATPATSQPRSHGLSQPSSSATQALPQLRSSAIQALSQSRSNAIQVISQPRSSDIQVLSQPRSNAIQALSQTGSSGTLTLPQPGPSGNYALSQPRSNAGVSRSSTSSEDLPSSNVVAHPLPLDSSDSDDDCDHGGGNNMARGPVDCSIRPHPCSTPIRSTARGCLVVGAGEAEALSRAGAGCEASSSSVRGQMSPLGSSGSVQSHVFPLESPSTPADNYVVSSSTGHIDSMPPTPAEFQGNNVSGPNSPASANLGSVAILDSTVDSTSGRHLANSDDQSSDNESDNSMGGAGEMQLTGMADEDEEISTSEPALQHSDDSQDVDLLVNPQGVFSTGRASATRFIEQLSLSLSHFSSSTLVVGGQEAPSTPLPPPTDAKPYLDDPLAIPGPSGVPQPSQVEGSSRQGAKPGEPQQVQTSVSSTHSSNNLRTTVGLNNRLPLLAITADLPSCTTPADHNHYSEPSECGEKRDSGNVVKGVEPKGMGVVTVSCDTPAVRNFKDASSPSCLELVPVRMMEEKEGEVGRINKLEGSEASITVNSSTTTLGLLNKPYDLELSDNNSSNDSGKTELANRTLDHDSFDELAADPESLLASASLSLTLAPSVGEAADLEIPGPSQPAALTHHLLPSQPDQVSLLVGRGGDDSGDSALLMMVSSDASTINHNTITLEKPLGQGEAGGVLSHLVDSPPQNVDLERRVAVSPPPGQDSDNQHQQKDKNNAEVEESHEVEAGFIGADFYVSESVEELSHTSPPHHIQSISDKPVKSRAWASLPAQHLAIRKVPGTEEFGVFARKTIPKKTQFGPLEGIEGEVELGEIATSPTGLIYSVVSGQNTLFHLDISDEGSSNWMRFVRGAWSFLEQNCLVVQVEFSLFFLTSTDIPPRTELRVGYSKQYAIKRSLEALQPTEEEMKVLESVRKCWPCFECGEGFETSAQLQHHLSSHDQDVCEEDRRKRKRGKGRRARSNEDGDGPGRNKFTRRLKVLDERTSDTHYSHDHHKGVVSSGGGGDGEGSLQHNQCAACSLTFTIPELLRIHQRSHPFVEIKQEETITLKEENNTCPQCSKVYESEVELYSHVEEHGFFLPSSSKPYKCHYCYKSFLRRERLAAHLIVHGNEAEKPFRCNLCLRRFCSNSALNTHIKFHMEGSKGYDCPICRQGFFSVATLKAHVTSHCVDDQYKCPTCAKVFPTYSKIRRHIRSYHAIMPHTCSICSKEMPSIDKLKIHMLSHSDRRDFLCQDCGKRFKRKDKLREHCQRMHSNQRPARAPRPPTKAPPKFVPKVDPTDYQQFVYKCHTCLLGFKRRGMLVNHLAKRHPNVDPKTVPELNQPILKATRCYYCQYCDKMYQSSSKRKLHILKYHPGAEVPPGPSGQCEGEGADGGSYSQTVGATKTYPHPCQWCYRQYASRARLLRHERHHHPELCLGPSHIKEYAGDLGGDLSGDMAGDLAEADDPLLENSPGVSGEITLGGQLVTQGGILHGHRLVNLSHGGQAGTTASCSEDDLLTQAMGEISPLAGGEQYVRLLGTGTEGQQMVVGTAQGSRPLLVSNDSGQQATTLALVTSDSPDTVTLSLPAGQFISLIPGISVASGASVVTPANRTVAASTTAINIARLDTQESAGRSQELQEERTSGIEVASTLGSSLNKEEGVDGVVLAAHQPPSPSNSVVWQQALTFTASPT